MAQFIKTSKGFINLDHVDNVTAGDNEVRIWFVGAESSFKVLGDEAARLADWFNRSAIFDAMAVRDFEDDPVDFNEAGELVYSE